jgi:hypothetical protein
MAAAALTVLPAKADSFNVSFNGGPLGYSGSATFVGSETSLGVWDISSVLAGGSVTDSGPGGFGTSAIVGLSPYAGSDNMLYYLNGGQYFDDSGLSFALANGVDINLFDFVAGSTVFESAVESNPNGDIPEFVTESVAAVTPEPSSLILLGTAAVLGAGDLFRRRRLA